MSSDNKNLKKLDIGMSHPMIGQAMVKEHSHEECELYLLTEGACTYLIDDEVYNITKGDLIIVPEHTIHRTYYDSEDVHVRMLCSLSNDLIPQDLYSLIFEKTICLSVRRKI